MKNKSPRKFRSILVTGGCGFIGSAFIRQLFRDPEFDGRIVNLDALTYAGSQKNLSGHVDSQRYFFVHGSICDRNLVKQVLTGWSIDCIVHFAAESHVDRSILGPSAFVDTNINGTFVLLDTIRELSQAGHFVHFHHISTDEVFGSLPQTGAFTEFTPYDPRSPYSASKAASDHLVRAYHNTYGLPVTISNCSNNYGPYQFPEKLIPFMLCRMMAGVDLPVYGDGLNTRDWLHVDDHGSAIWEIIRFADTGSTWNIGGRSERTNIEVIRALWSAYTQLTGKDAERASPIRFVGDRPGHDRRYAIDPSKIESELGWRSTMAFDEGIKQTVRWYLENGSWIEDIKNSRRDLK